jgi:hypothetical protein
MSRMVYEMTTILNNTSTGKDAVAEVDNFREGKGFDAYLAANKIPLRWNGKVYVGNLFGMEFTSTGPKEIKTLKGRH